mgnify:CR=1 FL=1
MIKHIVMWKLEENAEGNTKLENAKIIRPQFLDMNIIKKALKLIRDRLYYESRDITLFNKLLD